jgi:hypothetical protein
VYDKLLKPQQSFLITLYYIALIIMFVEQLTGKDLEGSDSGIIRVLSWHLLGVSEEKHEVFQARIPNVLSAIQTGHILPEV